MASIAACASAKPSTPALWRVSDADNSLYLLGSFHALKSGDYPLSQTVSDAYADAELLVFEIAPEQLQSPELAAEMLQAAMLPANQSLQGMLPEKTWLSLLQWQKLNPDKPLASLQRLKPWYAALIIANTQSKSQGFEPELGLDQHFMSQAKSVRKPSIGLERMQQQIALFNTMKPAAQLELLQEALQDSGEPRNGELERLRLLWKAGDTRELEKITVTKMKKEYPELYRSVNVERNQAWLPQLRRLLDDEREKDAMVVVGALHLLGPDGLVQQLQAKGYTVERLN
ncbi:MAG: TraB/GumN family protein [Arenimonas sp.]|nr:TraB/GumN family protein [Arenimonas sp.]MBP7917064.1 TraB/GumN family protein [Arenimonas sp.]